MASAEILLQKISDKEKYGNALNVLALQLCRIETDGKKMSWQKRKLIGALIIACEVLKDKLDELEAAANDD